MWKIRLPHKGIFKYNTENVVPCEQEPNIRQMGILSKPRRQRQRERGKTKGFISRTMAQHVHYKTLYISQSSSAKQQREITTFCVFKHGATI